MNELLQAGWNEPEEAGLDDQVDYRGEHLWIEEVHITSWDCPECLKHEDGRLCELLVFRPSILSAAL